MAQQQQGPPKGKLDFFEAIKGGATTDPNFNPGQYVYRVGQRANAGDFDIEFDTAKIKE